VVVENATKLCRGEWGYLFRRDGDAFTLIASHGGTPELIAYERSHPTAITDRTLVGRVALRRSVVHIADLFEDPDYDWPVNREHGVHTVLGVPIFRDDEVVGVIGAARNDPRPFSDADIRLVQTFADQAGIAMENVRLFKETKESLGQQTALSEVLKTISRSAFDLDSVLQTIAERAAALGGADTATISRREGDEAVVLAQFGTPVLASFGRGTRIPVSDATLVGRALLTGERQYVVDAAEHPELPQLGPRTRLAIPFLRDGKATGVLGVSHRLRQPFSDRELQMLETFADQAAIAIENVRLFNDTKGSLERQTALAEILRVIASSPSDQRPVFDAIATNAARYCGAEDALVFLARGDVIDRVAHHGPVPEATTPSPSFDRTGVVGRAILDGHTIHVADVTGPAGDDFPASRTRAAEIGNRGLLASPLMRDGTAIGAILLRKMDPSGFTPSQIQLVDAFADQAVIAIENVRLFNETKEALDRQSATAEVLRVMSASPFELKPVLDSLVATAARLCDADNCVIMQREGDVMRMTASSLDNAVASLFRERPLALDRTTITGRAVLDARTVHLPDASADSQLVMLQERPEFLESVGGAKQQSVRERSGLSVPLIRESQVIGAFTLWRHAVRPFSPRDIELIETFARQAVIAIENVRLFNETKDALDRETATGEVLKVISNSAFELQPVFETLIEKAVRLGGADNGSIARREGETFVFTAHAGDFRGQLPMGGDVRRAVKPDRSQVSGRVLLEGRTVQVPDTRADPEFSKSAAAAFGAGLGVPIIRGTEILGIIIVRRFEPGAFSRKQIDLLESFADQAAIAIENVRLFNETEEAVKQLTATSEILRVISETLGDPQPVMQAIVDTVLGVCLADSAGFFRRSGDDVILRAVSGSWRGPRPSADTEGVPFHGDSIVVQALEEGRYQHVQDTSADPRYDAAARWSRTRLAVPVLRGSETIGVIRVGRAEPGGFTEREIRLVEGFAEQAAIAFENARLFNETKEALEQQTAVGDVLKTISRSAFDLQPVLDIVLNNAVRLAGADIGWLSRVEDEKWSTVAYSSGFPQVVRDELANQRAQGHLAEWIPVGNRAGVMGLTLSERRTVHVPDIKEDEDLKGSVVARVSESRTVVGVPMLREGRSIGAIVLARYEVRAFDEREIELVQTFADQAAIAIENVRLFNDTKESLERQSAVSEVLKTISRTVFDLGPTLQTVVENAARLCDADLAWMTQRVGDVEGETRGSSRFGARWARTQELEARFISGDIGSASEDRRSIMGRTYAERRTIAVGDITAEQELDHSSTALAVGARSVLAVPVLRDDEALGVIVFARTAIRPFAAREVELVETFADQAAIAIQNVRLFSEIQDKSQQLEIASRHKSEFLANMSHELRTPLNAIIGFSEVLLQGIFGDINEKQREYLADVLGSGQHLLSLINDILDLSKIEAGRMDLELSTFPVRDALDSGLTIVKERATRNGIRLSASVASDVGNIEADERKVKQILYNLLSNAVKFTPNGGRVDISVSADNGDVRVEVRDTGIGVAAEDQERIFEEFRQVGRERSREGTGLGLTLTKRFIELHGGRIWLESTPGQGSTFAFTLPLRRAAPVRA
jgi:GAF domain-containing protein/anti-sigma regulatory factor (Ser/Thr protein kinase)